MKNKISMCRNNYKLNLSMIKKNCRKAAISHVTGDFKFMSVFLKTKAESSEICTNKSRYIWDNLISV